MLIRSSYVRKLTLGILSALTLALSMAPAAVAQDDLAAGLKKRFRITEINMQGVAANPGTVMTIEADGINAEPYPTMMTFENPVVDGQVKQRSKGLGLLRSNNSQVLQPGQKVYLTKINISSQSHDDDLKVTFLTCDAVLATFTNGTYGGQYQAAKRYSGTLAFKLPKGALAELSVDDAAKMIEAVLSENAADQVRARDSGTVARSCEPHCAVSTTTGTVVGNAIVAQPGAPAQAAAPTIALGQTIDQVTGTMGAPQQIIDLGAKKIYKYPDMKVIFMNGQVSDVQ
ncbi:MULTISPECIES: hypothetical protein [Acidobacteriaceae]|uniref:hypothetical protein n=1 Tax=Acidobacteriaceae TaxID=204434 RepID=UPI00131BCF2E|nr:MULTISPECIES: hypothetical protein [Acidobacteriaceae]MDW5265635.1 hypothetical protein [Edaphobacter sp.]